MKRNILIYNSYSSWGGGGEIQALLLKVLSLSIKNANINVLHIPYIEPILRRCILGFADASKFKTDIQKADLLILQSFFDIGSNVLAHYAILYKVPYILICRGNFVPTFNLFRIVRKPVSKWLIWLFCARRMVNKATAAIVTSQMEMNRLKRVGARSDHMQVIPNPILESLDSEEKAPESISREKWHANRPYALWLGRIAREKGLELLLECWPMVLEKCPRALLVIAGKVAHKKTYRQLVHMRRYLCLEESVLFHGYIRGFHKKSLLEEAQCLVLPSHFESFGTVVIEALDVGTPVVVSTGTPWEHINGIAGKWIPRKRDILANSIIEYLSAPQKMKVAPSLKKRLLKPYNILAVSEKWSTLLDDVLN